MWWSSVASASTVFMPPEGTMVAGQVDGLYKFLLISSFVSFVLLIGAMCWFVWKYRRRTATDKTAYITHNSTAEFLWSFIPFCIFIFVFAWGWVVFHEMRTFPSDSLEIHVMAKKWAWRFLYKNGREVTADVDDAGNPVPPTMVVPLGRPVKLIMASEKINPASNDDPTDRAVLHSFYIPAFRVKQDVVPGRYTALGFTAEQEGEFWVFCAEYCGANHWDMRAKVKVVPVAEYEAWLAGEQVQAAAGASTLSPLAQKGKALYAAKACIGCHTLNGTQGAGPTFKHLYMEKVSTDKGTVTADDDYLRESILQSQAKIVTGFPAGAMPVFAGTLSEDEVAALIEFIKSVK